MDKARLYSNRDVIFTLHYIKFLLQEPYLLAVYFKTKCRSIILLCMSSGQTRISLILRLKPLLNKDYLNQI